MKFWGYSEKNISLTQKSTTSSGTLGNKNAMGACRFNLKSVVKWNLVHLFSHSLFATVNLKLKTCKSIFFWVQICIRNDNIYKFKKNKIIKNKQIKHLILGKLPPISVSGGLSCDVRKRVALLLNHNTYVNK